MKKSLKIILPIVGCLLIILTVVLIRSCANNEYRNLDITFGKKYYNVDYVNNSGGDYYVFKANGTGEYVYSGTNSKIFFKYTVMDDNKIICFYHSGDGITATDWYRELMVSKNVIKYTYNSGYSDTQEYYYICENYIPQIPNFNS